VFAELVPPMGELYANPSASQAMLDDAAFDVEAWLAGEIAVEFAKAEGAAFVNGTGVNRPKGFLTGPTSAAKDGARALGTLQYLPSGAASDFGTAPDERLIDLVQSLRAPYRQGACWVMNAATLARIRKFKSNDGMPLWQPSLAGGQPASLLGYALRIIATALASNGTAALPPPAPAVPAAVTTAPSSAGVARQNASGLHPSTAPANPASRTAPSANTPPDTS
jgi:HK97 family phage major capsid protein